VARLGGDSGERRPENIVKRLTLFSNSPDNMAEPYSYVTRKSRFSETTLTRLSSADRLRVNVYTGEAEEREMRTGRHTVRDVFCKVCHSVLGWKYVSQSVYRVLRELDYQAERYRILRMSPIRSTRKGDSSWRRR
jgi:hypothetical protein